MKLEIRNLTCGYTPDKPIIKGLSMDIEDGDICCILGPNGVGKSTVFKTILNLIPPLGGQVAIDGENIKNWAPKRLAPYMAYVAQAHIPVFPYKVREIAMMGRMGQMGTTAKPSKEDYLIVEQALEDVGIRDLREKQYTEISGGERQLLMIARSLVQQPKILIMDEPTANLDYGNMVRVITAIKKMALNGLSVIFTTHMPDQAFMCNAKTILLMPDKGMIAGPADDVITETNLNIAYNTDVQIMKVVGNDGRPLKFVAPRFRYI